MPAASSASIRAEISAAAAEPWFPTCVSQDSKALSEKSFENLVNEHGRQVLNTALRVLGDVNMANDVHQEVFLAIWKRWPSYNGHTNWPAYLYRATVRKALEAVRRRNGYRGELPRRREACQELSDERCWGTTWRRMVHGRCFLQIDHIHIDVQVERAIR